MSISVSPAGTVADGQLTESKPRFGLSTKIILFLAAVLMPLTALAWAIAFWVIQTSTADEFTSKGTAIAISLAGSGVDPILNRDASTVQSLVDKFPAV